MDVLPARADAAASRGMDPMADAKNSPQRLDIEVHELAGPRPLVASDGRDRLERGQAIQAEPRQDGRHRGPRDLQADSDGPGGQPFVPRRADRADNRSRGSPRLAMWARRAIDEAGRAGVSIPRQPFVRRADRHTGGRRRRGDRLVQDANAMYQQGAHVRRGLGVRMKLHSGPPLGRNGTFGHVHSFQGVPE